jgi:hypothetical protein
MDRCIVTNNSVGGLLVNGGGYDIQNSIFAGNGFSQVQFSSTPNPGTPVFHFNTVVAATGHAATCDVNNMKTLMDSIVVGGSNCTLTNAVTTAPSFKTTPPYRLSAPIGCPQAPVSPVPAHDVDGDPRTVAVDCGADEFVP